MRDVSALNNKEDTLKSEKENAEKVTEFHFSNSLYSFVYFQAFVYL